MGCRITKGVTELCTARLRLTLQEKDIVLVKVVAHKGRHKLQDKWEPEEYVVIVIVIVNAHLYSTLGKC